MKHSYCNLFAGLALLVGLGLPHGARAQTLITFQNQGTGPTGPFLWPIYLPELDDPHQVKQGNTAAGLPPGTQTYSGGLVSGSGYTAQLWLGPENSAEGALAAVGTTTFRTGAQAGTLVPVNVTVPGIVPGTPVTWQARVWDNRGGTVTTWAQALADPSVVRGKTPLFTTAPKPVTTYNGQSFNLHREERPVIVTQPLDRTQDAGTTAGFSVTAAGASPLSYRWRKDGVDLSNNNRIAGATTATLSVSSLVTADAGNYSVVVSNLHGRATSAVARLTVLTPLVVTIPFSLHGSNSVFFHQFNVSTTGTLRAEVTWQGASSNLNVTLTGRRRPALPDPAAPYASVTGPPLLMLSNLVAATDLARGVAWRLVISDPANIGAATGSIRLSLPFSAPVNQIVQRQKISLRSGDLLPTAALQGVFLGNLGMTPRPGLHAIISLARAVSCDESDELDRLGLVRQSHLAKPGWHAFGFVQRGINLADPRIAGVLIGLTPLEPEDKIDPHILVGNYARYRVMTAGGLPANAVLNPNGSLNLTLVFAADASRDDILAILRAESASFEALSDRQWRVAIAPARLRNLAAYDLVEWIDPGPAPQMPDNSNTRVTIAVDPVQNVTAINAGPTITYGGLTGNGITAGVQDTGIDAAHPDLNVVATIAPNGLGSHGTHVAGILAGSGIQSSQNNALGNPNGGTNFQWRGMAPQAGLISSGDFDNAANLLTGIQNNSLDLVNRSQSVTFDGNYDAENQRVDSFIRGGGTSGGTAILRRPHHYSAGNHGTFPNNGGSQIGYYALTKQMKNVVIVGNWDGPNNILRLSSSLGPAHDGRIKPDVVAPGTSIISTGTTGDGSCVAPGVNLSSGYVSCGGTSMATPAVSGVVALLLQAWQNTYSTPLGTTIDAAAPLPSTTRALLIQTATDIVAANVRGATHVDVDTDSNPANGNNGLGAPSATAGPDYTTGWGQVNAQAAVNLLQDFRLEYRRPVPNRIIQDAANQGAIREFDFVVNQAGPVRVTLAWDDVEGAVQNPATSPMLVNDLDLELVDPNGTIFYPWQLGHTILDAGGNPLANNAQPPGTSIQVNLPITPTGTPAANNDYVPLNALTNNGAWVATTGKDHLNNVEQVFIPNVVAGQFGHWKVRVLGFDVRDGAQDFSVVGFPYPALPDLVATSNDKVGISAYNTPLVFTWTAANVGTAGTGGPFNYQVWLSRDFYVDAGDVALVDANQAALAALGLGASVDKTSSVQISQAQADTLLGNPPGTTTIEQLTSADVFLLVQVDSGNTVLEHNEVNVVAVQLARLVDLVLVMDRSGSMLDSVPVSSGSRPKIDLLKDSANLFLDLLRLDAGDEVGEVSFANTVSTDFGPGAVLTPITTGNLGDAKDAVDNLSAGGGTNIRDALQQGLNLITNAANVNHRRVIIFLSDGMRTVGGDPTEAAFLGQFAANGVTVYSVGFGTEGGTGNAGIDVPLLQTLANANPSDQGFFHVTESAVALDKFFVNAVAGAVRAEVVVDPEGDLPGGQTATLDAALAREDSFATFILTWDNPGLNLDLAVRSPTGLEVNAGNAARFADQVTLINRLTYKLMTLRFPLTGGPSEDHGGRWRMIIRNPGGPTVHYAASVIAESTIRASWIQPQPGAGGAFRPGDAFPLNVIVRDRGGQPVSGAHVTVTPSLPLVDLGNLLAAAGITPAELARIPASRNGETLSVAERMYLALLARGGGGDLLRRAELPSFELTPGPVPGQYVGAFGHTRVGGTYSFVARVHGFNDDCDPFQREVTGSVGVTPAPIPGPTGVTVGWNDPGNPTIVVVTVTPVLTGGIYLGPGAGSKVVINGAGGITPTTEIVDNLDGSYSRSFRVSDAGTASFAVSVSGVTLGKFIAVTGLPAPIGVTPDGGFNDRSTRIEILFPPGSNLSTATGASLRLAGAVIPLTGFQVDLNQALARADVPAGLTPGLYSVHLQSQSGPSPASPAATFRVIGRGQNFPGGVGMIATGLQNLQDAGSHAEGLEILGTLARDLRALPLGSLLTQPARLAAFNEVTSLLLRGQGLVFSNELGSLRSLVNAAKIDARVVTVGPRITDNGKNIHVELGNGVAATFESVLRPGETSARLGQGPKDIPEGYRGSPHIGYDIITTAELEPGAAIEIAIAYEEGDFPNEKNLRLLHREDGRWADRTSTLDTERNVIMAKVGHLSEFVIVSSSSAPAAVLQIVGFGQPGGFTFRLEGPPGTYEILVSKDLRDWTGIGFATINSLPVNFTDPEAARDGSRFYRAVRVQ